LQNQEKKPEEGQKPEQEQKPQSTPQQTKKERPEECVVCNKSLKKRWYYREGDYYCGKSCWKKAKKSKEKSGTESEKTNEAK